MSKAPDSSVPNVSFVTRLWFAWVCFFRVLFDAEFARRAYFVRDQLPQAPSPAPLPSAVSTPETPSASDGTSAALQLLGILQREGRLVDFLEQDITTFADAEIGAAARAVHAGARKALHAHVKVEPIRNEEEESRVTLPPGYDPGAVKLTGNVTGKAPFTGVLRHRGWRATEVSLPELLRGHDAHVLCPAEVEL